MTARVVHRATWGQTPCGLPSDGSKTGLRTSRRPEEVTCRSCRKIQAIPGAVVSVALD